MNHTIPKSIIENNKKRLYDYHYGQYQKPYRSTEVFVDWIDERLKRSDIVCDIACGGGANLHYMSSKYPHVKFEGIDIEPNNIDTAKKMIAEKNVEVFLGDLFNLPNTLKNRYSGLIFLQSLFMFDYKKAIKCLTDLNPNWIAISSLCYEGNVEYTIEVKDYTRGDENNDCLRCNYNIDSLPRLKEYFNELGYSNFEYKKFDIDIDIEKPVADGIGTYTRKMEDGSRIQISAGLMLPWYFIVASK